MWKYLVCCVLVVSEYCYSAEPASDKLEVVSSSNIISLVSGLLIVILIFLCLAFLIKRLTGISSISRGHIKMIDALHLGTREKLVLVRVAGTYMVLGISPGRINALHIIDGELPSKDEQALPSFKSRINELLSPKEIKSN